MALYICPAVFFLFAMFSGLAAILWPVQVRNARQVNASAIHRTLETALTRQAGDFHTELEDTRDAYEQRLESQQARSETAMRNLEHRYARQLSELQAVHTAYVSETQGRVQRVESVLALLEDETGLDLLTEAELDDYDEDTDYYDSATTYALDGAGGAPHFFLGRVNPEAISYYDSRRLMEMDEQTQRLDVYYDNADKALDTLQTHAEWLSRTPMIAPVAGKYQCTDTFGSRIHPVYKRRDFHSGLDMAANRGTPIVAPADGKVVKVGSSSTMGRYFEIDHGQGARLDSSDDAARAHFRTRYYHCSKILVSKGQTVKRGETIAKVGSTGVSTGAHLHYEVLVNGENVDPADYILDQPLKY